MRAAASIGISSATVFALGGIVFGFSSLFPTLYYEGALVDVCGASAAQCTSQTTKCCNAQMMDYTLLSTLSFFASDSAMVGWGECIDRLGPRTTLVISSACGIAALLLIGMNVGMGVDWLWFGSFVLLGSCGPGVFMGALTFAEVFPEQRALAISVAAAMWDTSSVVFLLFNSLYFDSGLSFSTIAYGWAILSAVLCAATFALLPSWRQLQQQRAAVDILPAPASSRSDGDRGDPLLLQAAPLVNPRITPTRLVIDPVRSRLNSRSGSPPRSRLSSNCNSSSRIPSQRFMSSGTLPDAGEHHCGGNVLDSGGGVCGGGGNVEKVPMEHFQYEEGDGVARLLCRRDSMLMLLFMCCFNLRSSFYIATMSDELTVTFDQVRRRKAPLCARRARAASGEPRGVMQGG